MDFEVLEWRFVTGWKIKDSVQSNCGTLSRCPAGWSGYTCEIAAAPVDSSASSGSKSHSTDHMYPKVSFTCFSSRMFVSAIAGTASIVVPVLLLLLLALMAVGAILWYKRRMRG